ncbi:hypothetical protein BD289DRAFT_448816 [Coniella lustricola]|uniref:Uncharacterized protein n=1 Tax=Coniella lustricola TaxID=2025994 RepID=A0A2T2ZRW1_9PEZI|nr:hypothetical protein BD289DRAFT_448816 [Coniella lustricola]
MFLGWACVRDGQGTFTPWFLPISLFLGPRQARPQDCHCHCWHFSLLTSGQCLERRRPVARHHRSTPPALAYPVPYPPHYGPPICRVHAEYSLCI